MPDSVTPIRQQYLDIKKQYPDAIVFFRLGDFYETFDDDARTAAEVLDIVLTSRPVAKGIRVPMAGIPYHAVDNYLGRLIEKKYHVAICEQVGEQPDKGIFPREVIRVVTPGTLVEPNLLPSGKNNYLACFFQQDNKAGLAYVDISTGELAATELSETNVQVQLLAELERIGPAEVLVSDALDEKLKLDFNLARIPNWYFEPGRAQELIKSQFNLSDLEGLGLKPYPLAVRATGALLKFLQETQKGSQKLELSFSTYSLSDFMVLDAETRRNLELTETLRENKTEGSLLGVLDKTHTAMGKRLLRSWVNKPLLDVSMIEQRLEAVTYFFERGVERQQIAELLKQLHDIERLVNRINSGNARPNDLLALREDLTVLPQLLPLLDQEHPALQPLLATWQGFEPELELLNAAISDDPPATLNNIGLIREGFSKELDQVVSSSKHARDWINSLESSERQRTGLKTLRVGFNKVFGYYIEISRGLADKAPEEYIRKQTLVNSERYITPELKEYESLVLNAETQIHEIELKVFKQVCAQLGKSSQNLLDLARKLAQMDCLLSLAEVAALNNYVRPKLTEEKGIVILEGRHPVVERISSQKRYIANDTIFEPGEIIRLITGPNMSGKSTFLRQVVLIVLMAQIGSFVPAEKAEIGIVDRVFTRIGAQDAIHQGQSTFMVEMLETANILNNATPRSLLILDEIGRGTSTYDGLSIAWSIIEHLHSHPKLKPYTLFATHYHELTELADLYPGVRNYNVAVSEADDQVIFLHKIVPGAADRSYGIHVAQMAGLPSSVISRANEILKQLEATSGTTLPELKEEKEQLRLFPENNPLKDAFKKLDLEALTPIQALNKLYEWKQSFFREET
jgi:DNA mismatch repair protein MutS